MNEVKNEHEQKRTLTVDVFIPDHPDRSNTPIFEATRRELITHNPEAKCEVDNGHCDHDHPLELHHKHVEWCDSNGVDWEKVKQEIPDFPWATFDPSKPETFIDSKWNAKQVLCKKHHTGVGHGIHCLDGPTWQMQKLQKADFVFSPDEEVKS
jgi:hypothetical protein